MKKIFLSLILIIGLFPAIISLFRQKYRQYLRDATVIL